MSKCYMDGGDCGIGGFCKDCIAKLKADNQRLLEAHREVIEIYAGMEGFLIQTAPEGYQQMIIKQMYELARSAIKEVGDG